MAASVASRGPTDGTAWIAKYEPPAIRKPAQYARRHPRARATLIDATTSDARAAVERALAHNGDGERRAANATPQATMKASRAAIEKRGGRMAVPRTGWKGIRRYPKGFGAGREWTR